MARWAFRCFLPAHHDRSLSGPIPAVQPNTKSHGGSVVPFANTGSSGVLAKKCAQGPITVQKLENICNEGPQQGNMTRALQRKSANFDGRDFLWFCIVMKEHRIDTSNVPFHLSANGPRRYCEQCCRMDFLSCGLHLLSLHVLLSRCELALGVSASFHLSRTAK